MIIDCYETIIPGNYVGIADFILYPIVEMSPMCFSRFGGQSPLINDRFERLNDWMTAMRHVGAVQKEAISVELHREYIHAFLGLENTVH